jgi:Ran GTPase-activating protein (RanGAP) involved in mRNA processing and transport/TPR repeat protein
MIGADSTEGAEALARGLEGSQVQHLVLSGNNFGSWEGQVIAAGIKESTVQHLDLGNNQIGAEGAKALARVLGKSVVQHLYLGANSIGNPGAEVIGSVLKGSQVQHLDLRKNNIRAAGAKAFARSLEGSNVQHLDLSENNLGVEGAKALAAVLKESGMQHLNLRESWIGDEGAKAIGSVLKGSQVKYLNLSDNALLYRSIGDDGVKVLACGLKGSSVQHLYLEGNKIGDEGVRALAVRLKESGVQHLDLGRNQIGDEGTKVLADVLMDSQVQYLNLEGNNIGAELEEELYQIVAKNKRRLEVEGKGIKKEEENEERAPQKETVKKERPSLDRHLNPLPYETQDVSDLLARAGLTGEGEVQKFTSPLDQARSYLEQKDPNLYPTILKLLGPIMQGPVEKETLTFQAFGLEEETSTDEVGNGSSVVNPEEALDLLKELSLKYPRALLSLGRAYAGLGETHAAVQTYQRALREQLPGTLEQLKGLFETDGHPLYAELMAENFIEGYMGPVNLKEGETYLRRALEREPTNPDLQTKVAKVLIDQGGLEDKELYAEIMDLLTRSQETSVEAAVLLLQIEEEQSGRAVKDVGVSSKAQEHTARQQRILRALHQAQFKKQGTGIEGGILKELPPDQQDQLRTLKKKQTEEVERLTEQLAQVEEDLTHASPMDRKAIEADRSSLSKKLQALQETHQAELKRILFPGGLQVSPMLKVFYESLRASIRQQFSLQDAIEGGLATREDGFMETQWKEAIGQAVGYVGDMVISNIPIPANGILGMIVKKGLRMGIDKITEKLQDRVGQSYDQKAEKARQHASQAIGGFEHSAFVAKGLASIYTYRLQNILPYLTEKSVKTLSGKLAFSVIQYLQDTRRMTNPENLTQLATLSFYHKKGATVGDLIQKARKKQGLKLIDGKKTLSYSDLFRTPTLETTDGAQYQLGETPSENVQIVPLIERSILQSELLQGKQVAVTEVQLPQLSPLQVSVIEEQDDADYIRRAVQFVSELS